MKWLGNIGFVAIYCLSGAVHGADPVQRIDDPVLLARGQALFQQHCAACHGDKAQGTVANWQQRDASGKLPPPPLNGTAHAWHHSINGLARTIREGINARMESEGLENLNPVTGRKAADWAGRSMDDL